LDINERYHYVISMASVHRRVGSPYWYASFRDISGRQLFRSTKQRKKSEALRFTLEMENAAKQIESLSESQAVKIISDLMDRIGRAPIRNPSIQDFFAQWLSIKTGNITEGTAVRYKFVVKTLLKELGESATRPLKTLSPEQLNSFIQNRIKTGCSPSTANMYGKILTIALNYARKQGLIVHNPVEAIELPSKKTIERGTFTPQEVKILFDQASGEWKTIILFGYYTGARLLDCCRMEWGGVDFQADTLTYQVKKKGGVNHTIPLNGNLKDHLLTLATSDKAEKFITPEMAAKGPGGCHGLSEGFKRIARAAGVDLQTVPGYGRRNISRRTFHALRHSATSAMANAGVAEEVRMKVIGHSSKNIHRGYTHHEYQIMKSAIETIPPLD
jgi:integrase